MGQEDQEDQEVKEKLAQLRRDLEDLEEKVESAFLRDEQGVPDYSGHRTTHKDQVVKAEDIKRTKASIIKNIATWAAIGLLTVVGSNLAQVHLWAAAIVAK